MQKYIDFRKFPETIGNQQPIRNAKLLVQKQRPYVYPFAKDLSFPYVTSQTLRSNYMSQFNLKQSSRRKLRPSSSGRRHNPQSRKAFHLLRIYNEPVCDVTTSKRSSKHDIIKSSMTQQATPLSTCRSAFRQLEVLPKLTERFRNNPKAATNIIPVELNTKASISTDPVILLPACQMKEIDFMTSHAWKMNPRKRKFFPLKTNHNWSSPQGCDVKAEETMTTTTMTSYKPLLPLRRRTNRKHSRILDSSIFTK